MAVVVEHAARVHLVEHHVLALSRSTSVVPGIDVRVSPMRTSRGGVDRVDGQRPAPYTQAERRDDADDCCQADAASSRRAAAGATAHSGRRAASRLPSVKECPMAERRLKHWGWGYEDQQPPTTRSWPAAEGIRAHLGFGDGRGGAPGGAGGHRAAPRRGSSRRRRCDICGTDPYERASHALGKSYRDVVRGFRGEFAHPPDVVALPRDEADVERCCRWCATPDAVAIPFGGGTSVVGGVEPRGSSGPSCRSTCAGSTGCWRSTRLPRRPHPGRGHRAGPRGAAAAARAHAAPLSRSRSSSPRSAAGSPPAPAGTSPRCRPTSTTWSSRCGRSPRAATWESRRLPGLRRRARAPTGC